MILLARADHLFPRQESSHVRPLTFFVRRADVMPWFADFVQRPRVVSTRPVNNSDGPVDVVVRRAGFSARRAGVVRWSALPIARSLSYEEGSRELSSRHVMSFGRAAKDFGASIQLSVGAPTFGSRRLTTRHRRS